MILILIDLFILINMNNKMQNKVKQGLAVIASAALYAPLLMVMAQSEEVSLAITLIAFIQKAGILAMVVFTLWQVGSMMFTEGVLNDTQGAAQKKKTIVNILIAGILLIVLPAVLSKIFDPTDGFLKNYAGEENVTGEINKLLGN